jgi:hypothetical protein
MYIKKDLAKTCIEFHEEYGCCASGDPWRIEIGEKYYPLVQSYQSKPGNRPIKTEPHFFKVPTFSGMELPNRDEITYPFKLEPILPYMAGLFDAGLYLSINEHSMTIIYKKNNKELLESISSVFGGQVHRTNVINKQKQWQLQYNGQKAYGILQKVYPYLKIKKEPARLCMEYFDKYHQLSPKYWLTPEKQKFAEHYASLITDYKKKSVPHKTSSKQ